MTSSGGLGRGRDADLGQRGESYVRTRLTQAGGFPEAAGGIWHKTLPVLLRVEGQLTAARMFAVFARIALLIAAAAAPVVIRKAIQNQTGVAPQALPYFLGMFERLDPADYMLGGVAVAAVFVPKLLDAIDRRKHVRKHLPYYDLAAAIEQMPAIDAKSRGRDGESQQAITDAIDSTLRALRDEMAELVDEPSRERVMDVTLLEFCDDQGSHMRVRSRTARKDPNGRPVPSERLMAYAVALAGKPFIENDFLSTANPYPKFRVTVANGPRVNYRSILYLPILWASAEHRPPVADGAFGPSTTLPVDVVLGVVCINCSKPYRFWRWGDHKRPGSAFESVAYERALPYIALLTKLLELTAPKVPLEAI